MIFPPHALLLSCIFIWLSKSLALAKEFQSHQFETDCGSRPPSKDPRSFAQIAELANTRGTHRTARIIAGSLTKEGQFPWQASLELLHPSLGFLGHWCGGVLIHQYWVLSAAHCVHNDLFNLPIPPLWTVVLGEHNRVIETGNEQRIPVEKIVLHKNYENFMHDLMLMKLSRPADLSRKSHIRRICLPFVHAEHPFLPEEVKAETFQIEDDPLEIGLSDVPERLDNFLRRIRRQRNLPATNMYEIISSKIILLSRAKEAKQRQSRALQKSRPKMGRRNDKFMRIRSQADELEFEGLLEKYSDKGASDKNELPFIDCIATGWGKANITGDLTDSLLKINVPLHNTKRCKDAYGSFVKIHRGHLCAGKLNGKGGTCVGDSGGPLQCRLVKNGPWILAGITSFGSGCAIAGFPDVYTRTSFYMKWIQDTIALE